MTAHRGAIGRSVRAARRAQPEGAVLLVLNQVERPLALHEPQRVRLMQLVALFRRKREHAWLRLRLAERLTRLAAPHVLGRVHVLEVVLQRRRPPLDADRLVAHLAELLRVREHAVRVARLSALLREVVPAGIRPPRALRWPRSLARALDLDICRCRRCARRPPLLLGGDARGGGGGCGLQPLLLLLLLLLPLLLSLGRLY